MIPMYHRYSSEIDIKHQNIHGSTTSLDTKNEKHQLLLIEGQINLYRPVSIEKMSPVERQVKDTSSASITTVTFKNQGTQRALYLYKVPNFMPCPCGNLQRRIDIMQNRIQRSSTQWSSAWMKSLATHAGHVCEICANRPILRRAWRYLTYG